MIDYFFLRKSPHSYFEPILTEKKGVPFINHLRSLNCRAINKLFTSH